MDAKYEELIKQDPHYWLGVCLYCFKVRWKCQRDLDNDNKDVTIEEN